METEFVYCTCQPGVEPALKAEVAARTPGWKFAFSRPGFVTFKLPEPTTPARFDPTRLTFARAVGMSYGRVEAADGSPDELARLLWEHEAVSRMAELGPTALHVWARDLDIPGENGVEPGPTDATRAAVDAIRSAAPEGRLVDRSDGAKEQGSPGVALDVVMVEPTQWWFGAHSLRSRVDRWPGGTQNLKLPEYAVSRAYLKMQEGLRWSGMPAKKGDYWVELGCAPGGASQALLDAGMNVVGVDPAEVDPIVSSNPSFEHLRARASEIGVDEITDASWIAADINVAPQYTLDSVERLVTHPSIHVRGLLLTLKLLSLNLARPEVVAETIARVRSWGYSDVRTRQLAHNRREYCLAALRTRGQRRVSRNRKEKPRRGEGA